MKKRSQAFCVECTIVVRWRWNKTSFRKSNCKLSRKFWISPPREGHRLKIFFFRGQLCGKTSICGSCWISATSVFFTSFRLVKAMLLGCQSYALRLSLVANERLRCRKWQGQRPQMTPSEATNEKSVYLKWREKIAKIVFLYKFLS